MLTSTAPALQVFYGSLPLLLAVVGLYVSSLQRARRENALLTDTLKRLGSNEGELKGIRGELSKIRERLVGLETHAGVIYHE